MDSLLAHHTNLSLEQEMTTAKNDITGDSLKTKQPTKQYDEGWDRIFKKEENQEEKKDEPSELQRTV